TFSGSGLNLKWASLGDPNWDAGATSNWVDLASSASQVFYQGDTVLFDDSLGVQTALALGVSVSPTAITTISSANSFTIRGAGKISGAATLFKDGSSTLTLGTANDYTGAVLVNAGALRATNLWALGRGLVTVNGAGTLVVGAPQTNSITLNGGTMGAV